MIQTKFIPQGWECPKCNRVYSPTTIMCSYCPQHTQGLAIAGSSTSVTYSHQFESDKKSSSKTKCSVCGKEKWEHPNITYTQNR
jgi:uncharacterized OB-fold protein